MSGKVFTGALGIVKIGSTVIGKMQSISANENYNRTAIGGIGTIYDTDVPITKFSGSFTAAYTLIDWNLAARIEGQKRVGVGSAAQFEMNAILADTPITIDVYKKVSDGLDGNGNVKQDANLAFQINDCYMDSESFNLAEGGVGSHNQSFRYLTPIMYAEKGNEGVAIENFDRSIR